jgi:GH18 family chitinase
VGLGRPAGLLHVLAGLETLPGTSIGYLSFEDEQGILAKGQWVKANGIGGTIIWTINYGCTNKANGNNPLLTAVKNAFK